MHRYSLKFEKMKFEETMKNYENSNPPSPRKPNNFLAVTTFAEKKTIEELKDVTGYKRKGMIRFNNETD